MQTTATINESLLMKVMNKVIPSWAREERILKEKSVGFQLSIQSYSETSQKVQSQIDNNHFAPFLQYEKKQS